MSSAAGDGGGPQPSRDVRPIGDGVGMDEHGSSEGGRTRLARGTKRNAAVSDHERADGANANAAVPASAPRGGDEARMRSALLIQGSGPVPAGSAPSGAGRAPAQSIREAVEQLIEAQEAAEAVAEWMQGGG